MRALVVVVSSALALAVSPAFGQAPAQPAGQAAQAPAAPPSPAAEAPVPPAPFPQGAKVAYVNLQAIAQLSNDGKAAATKVQQLTLKKQAEVAEKTKALQAQQQKLQTGAGVMSDEARGQLEKDVDRMARDLERFQQDAQTELTDLQQTLQDEFQKKLIPILGQISGEKGLHFLFSSADAGLVWAADGLDLTAEAVKRLDSATAGK